MDTHHEAELIVLKCKSEWKDNWRISRWSQQLLIRAIAAALEARDDRINFLFQSNINLKVENEEMRARLQELKATL
jgi:regulator of replication initiation timing